MYSIYFIIYDVIHNISYIITICYLTVVMIPLKPRCHAVESSTVISKVYTWVLQSTTPEQLSANSQSEHVSEPSWIFCPV